MLFYWQLDQEIVKGVGPPRYLVASLHQLFQTLPDLANFKAGETLMLPTTKICSIYQLS